MNAPRYLKFSVYLILTWLRFSPLRKDLRLVLNSVFAKKVWRSAFGAQVLSLLICFATVFRGIKKDAKARQSIVRSMLLSPFLTPSLYISLLHLQMIFFSTQLKSRCESPSPCLTHSWFWRHLKFCLNFTMKMVSVKVCWISTNVLLPKPLSFWNYLLLNFSPCFESWKTVGCDSTVSHSLSYY